MIDQTQEQYQALEAENQRLRGLLEMRLAYDAIWLSDHPELQTIFLTDWAAEARRVVQRKTQC